MPSLQIFIYNVYGINDRNNYPFIEFDNDIQQYNFIDNLQSIHPDDIIDLQEEPWFVVNNLALLRFSDPIFEPVIKKHLYDNKFHKYFLWEDNWELLSRQIIGNNTREPIGLSHILEREMALSRRRIIDTYSPLPSSPLGA